jgi:hypothetical protein
VLVIAAQHVCAIGFAELLAIHRVVHAIAEQEESKSRSASSRTLTAKGPWGDLIHRPQFVNLMLQIKKHVWRCVSNQP